MKIFQPLFISLILRYFNGTMAFDTTIIFAVAFSVFASIGGVLHHPYYYNSSVDGMKMRLALSGLIYRKVMKLGSSSLNAKSAGDIVNLLATDTTRVEVASQYLMYIAVGPLQAIVVVAVILNEIGVSFLAGLLLLIAILPIKGILGRIFNRYRLLYKLIDKFSNKLILLYKLTDFYF